MIIEGRAGIGAQCDADSPTERGSETALVAVSHLLRLLDGAGRNSAVWRTGRCGGEGRQGRHHVDPVLNHGRGRFVVEERKRREIDPTIAMLRQCAADAAADSKTDPEVKARIESMMLFLEGLTGWYDQVKALPKATLVTLIKMGARVAKFVAKVA